jgi:hypothetical protein
MPDETLVFNGIDGDTGTYALPPMSAEELVQVIRGEVKPENLGELRFRVQQATTGHLGVKEGVDPTNLAEAGWGVIFPTYPADDTANLRRVAAIREALQPLLHLREKDTGGRFSEWIQGTGKGVRPGESKNAYLARHGVGPGPADPDRVPYYLLIVGGPEEIPYRFQSQLDVQYAVGRLHFDTLEEYANYAANVVALETGGARLRREAAFFGVANPNDDATKLSSSLLVNPLAGWMRNKFSDWGVQQIQPAQATKATLSTLLGGAATPTLLFSACHGMKFDQGAERHLPHQGALLCQDWPGPDAWERGRAIPQDFYFAADDLSASADLLGLIACFFACYGAGTPQFSDFGRKDSERSSTLSRSQIAAQPFLSRLPQRMLGKPRGALAVVGHIERAWSYSFSWGRAGAQTAVFESMLQRLLMGHPLGSALEYFNERYAELSTVLSDELEDIDFGKRYDPFELAGLWTANNDARGYAIIGDPAVRLPVARDDTPPVERAAITLQRVAPPVPPVDASRSAAGEAPSEPAPVEAPPVAMSVTSLPPSAEVRTYISAERSNPPEHDLAIVTRRTADGTLETIVRPDVTQNPALLALHQKLIEGME